MSADPGFGWWQLAQALLDRVIAQSALSDDPAPDGAVVLARAEATADRAIDDFAAMVQRGDSAFAQVCASCDLDDVDAAVLALLCACELEPRLLQQAVAVGGRGVSRVTVGVLLAAFGTDGVRAVAPGARLVRCGLVEVETTVALSAAALAVPGAVVWRLLDETDDPRELPDDTRVMTCPPELAPGGDRVLVHGQDRVRRLQAAMTATLGMLFYASPAPTDDEGWRALTRRACLDGAGLVIELEAAPGPHLRRWIETCDQLAWALSSPEPIDLHELPDADWLDVRASSAPAGPAEWAAVFGDDEYPSRMPTASQLHSAAKVAASAESPADAIRRVASGSLLKHARRVVPSVGWDELILPPAQDNRLRELVDRYRYRSVVHDDWGLPLFPSPGVVALFSGPSGTGKTTAAEVIAHELGVDMFRVDLSALVSKYIGETEKNLEEIFSAAHAGDYLLLFDEADSLFGTRSKVSDARDRYANMEVSYLLQRLETYDGFVVLTSNFQGNIDQAFLRRIHATVHFTVPTAEDRERIWRRSLATAPTADLDLPFVAQQFDLAGGSIRNAALTAAFFAAGAHRSIGMIDVLRAVTQEMGKLGRRVNDDQFGRWLPELKD